MQLVLADLAFYPLSWEVIPVLAVKGVKLSPLGARNRGASYQWNRSVEPDRMKSYRWGATLMTPQDPLETGMVPKQTRLARRRGARGGD